MDAMDVEYGIQHTAGDSTEPHRTGMTRDEAWQWLDEFIADGGRKGAFIVIIRELGPWKHAIRANELTKEAITPDTVIDLTDEQAAQLLRHEETLCGCGHGDVRTCPCEEAPWPSTAEDAAEFKHKTRRGVPPSFEERALEDAFDENDWGCK